MWAVDAPVGVCRVEGSASIRRARPTGSQPPVNHRRRLLRSALKFSDLAAIVVSFLLSVAATVDDSARGLSGVFEVRLSVQNALFLGMYLLGWHIVLRSLGLYGSQRLEMGVREAWRLCVAVLLAVFALAPLGVLFSFSIVTPAFLGVFAASTFLALVCGRALVRMLARQLCALGMNGRSVLVIGNGRSASDAATDLGTRTGFLYDVVEVVPLPEVNDRLHREELLSHIETRIERHPVDEVIVAVPSEWQTLSDGVVRLCDEQGVLLRVTTTKLDLQSGRSTVGDIGGNPVVTVFSGPPEGSSLLAKRLFDLVGAAIGVVVLAPVMVVVAIAIRLDSRGPVIFAQERVGQNRRRFPTYKFRTMVEGADGMQVDLEHLNEANGPVFKIRSDPRITRIGGFLRKSSLDELPQLFNVLRGDMSLVGPRPLPVRDVERIEVRWHRRRFSVKPGITCTWQASGREPDFDEWIRTDMEYIDDWSLGLDLKIILKTIPAVLTHQGAH